MSLSEDNENVMTLRESELMKAKVRKRYRLPNWKLKINAFHNIALNNNNNNNNINNQNEDKTLNHSNCNQTIIDSQFDSIPKHLILNKSIDSVNHNIDNKCVDINIGLINENKSLKQQLIYSQNECKTLKKMLNVSEINCKILQRKLNSSENDNQLLKSQIESLFIQTTNTEESPLNVLQNNQLNEELNQTNQNMINESENDHNFSQEINFFFTNQELIDSNLDDKNEESIETNEKNSNFNINNNSNEETIDELSKIAKTSKKRRNLSKSRNKKEMIEDENHLKCQFCGKICEKKHLNLHLAAKHKQEWNCIRTTKPRKRSKH
jgi:hypothetical protein